MTWFGVVLIIIETLGLFKAIGDPNNSDGYVASYVIGYFLLLAGILFVGTGHL